MRVGQWGVTLFVLQVVLASTVVAQDPVRRARDAHSAPAPATDSALPPGYKEAFQRGSDEMRRGKFVEARASFRRAHDLFPNARTLRGLGKVEFELYNYLASVRLLERSLASETRPLSPAMREETGELLEVARGLVTELRFVLKPGTATASLDGKRLELGPSGRLPVVVGKHELIVQAPGYLALRRELDVEGGPETRIEVSLLPVQDAARDGGPLYEQWWYWTAAGAVAVVGAVVAGIALTSGDTYAPNTSIDGAEYPMALTSR